MCENRVRDVLDAAGGATVCEEAPKTKDSGRDGAGDEWNYFKQTAAMSAEVDGVVKSMEPEVVLEMGRNVRPILSELAREQIVTALSTGDDSIFRPKKSPSPNGGIGGLTSLLGGKVGEAAGEVTVTQRW